MKGYACRFIKKTVPVLLPLLLMMLAAFLAASPGEATATEYSVGSINGHVTDVRDGHPLAGIYVFAQIKFWAEPWESYWYNFTNTVTDSEGNYSLSGLPPATGPNSDVMPHSVGPVYGYYHVEFHSPDGSYYNQTYGDSGSIPPTATLLTLWPGDYLTGIDAAMIPVETCAGDVHDLRLTKDDVRWGSYADFVARNLSIDYTIANAGAADALNVGILGADNTGGVSLSTSMPVGLGDIAAAGSVATTLDYYVPEGVLSFQTNVYAAALDRCGTVFYYPGGQPPPIH